MSRLLRPVCWFAGHDNATEQPDQFLIICRRCGRDTTVPYFAWFRRKPWQIATVLVWIANQLVKDSRGCYPEFRPIDQGMKGIGTKHSCGAYSYEGIVSLLKQYENDGLPEPKLSVLISEEGWIDLDEHPEMAEQVIEQMNRDLTLEATRQEQEELNRDD